MRKHRARTPDPERSTKKTMSSTRPSDQELGGMTVNERLVLCGVIDKWDAAVKRRNKNDMIAIFEM
jgi:hypothetical protein